MAFIECRKLTREYRRGENMIRPLEELDLDVERGSFLALMGPSGSGKTTLLNLIAGIDRPTSGLLTIDGTDVGSLSRSALARWRAEHVGYVFQLYNLVPVLTAYENVELPLLLHKLSRSERHAKVSSALELVGIADRHDHFPRQLSGGQEQRVAIARAIVADPTIIVADEPTGDLDAASAAAIMSLMQRLNAELGKTLIMVTHDPKTAAGAEADSASRKRSTRRDRGHRCHGHDGMRFSMPLRFLPLIIKQITRRRIRSVLTVLSVAVAMFLFAAVQSMQAGVKAATEASASDATLVVYRENRFCPFTSRLPEYYQQRIERIPEVQRRRADANRGLQLPN